METLATLFTGILALVGGWFAPEPTLGAFGDPFLSVQVGSSPSNGYYLKTDGTNSTWATVTAGGSGNVATSSAETAGQLPYWTSRGATPATLGGVATTSVSCEGILLVPPSPLSVAPR